MIGEFFAYALFGAVVSAIVLGLWFLLMQTLEALDAWRRGDEG